MGSGDKHHGYGGISAVCTAVITQLFNPAPSQPAAPQSATRNGLLNDHGYPSPPPSADSSPQMGSEFPSAAKAASARWPREGIDTPPHSPVVTETAKNIPDLMDFIAYALYRTRLPTPIIHSALVLLTKLKKLYPSARGTSSSPHRLFLSALMLASKMSMDDTYSNRSWCIVGQQLFTLPEVNRMERELFGFLNWNCCVSGPELEAWTAEWLSPNGIVGDVASGSSSAAARRSLEERKRRRSSTTGSTSQSQPSRHAAAPSSRPEPADDRHRQATDAARALLRPSGPSASDPIAPPARRVSVPNLPSSASAPSIVESHEWRAPLSPTSPCRVRSMSHPRWSSSSSKPDRPAHDPMHMRQSSDASMRSLSSACESESSSCNTSGRLMASSMCCSSVGSPHSYLGSDSPASVGPPRTPDEFDEGIVAPAGKWDETPSTCEPAKADSSPIHSERDGQDRRSAIASAW